MSISDTTHNNNYVKYRMANSVKQMTGYRLYHSKLLAAGETEAAAAYASKRNIVVSNGVSQYPTGFVGMVTTPGGEGVGPGGGSQNWDSSTAPSKNGVNRASTSAEKILAKDLTATTTGTLGLAGEPILATVEQLGDAGDTQVAAGGEEKPRENIGGVARERCPEGVWWAMVTGDQINRLRKDIRLHPSGEVGVLHVGYRLCARLGERLKFEWFPVMRSREPGQEKDWVVFQGPMIP